MTQIHNSTTCRAGVNGAKCEMCQFAQHLEEVSEVVKTWEPWERHIFGGVCGVPDCPCHEFALKTPSEASSSEQVARVGFSENGPPVTSQPLKKATSDDRSGQNPSQVAEVALDGSEAANRPQTQNTAISVNGHLLYTEQNCSVFHDSDKQCPVCEGGLAVCRLCNEYEAGLDEPCRKAQLTKPITIPTFEQEWQDAPRWVREYVEQGRLRAVLFDVIDQGYTCGLFGQRHPWKFDDPDENFANEQRTQFVDEVIRRLKTTKINIAQYWFIRGQYAKEVELLVTENGDLREIARVVRERLGR